jgi:hypothetical protein
MVRAFARLIAGSLLLIASQAVLAQLGTVNRDVPLHRGPSAKSPHPLGQPTIPEVSPAAEASCDASLWNHVYNARRLTVKQSCIAVTGTIVDATAGRQKDGVRHEKDGDTHGWLKPDSQFENLLNAGNRSAEGGNLVFEIVCKYPVKQQDAIAACKGY